MALIYDMVTAPNLAGYWNTSQANVETTLGERAFPAKKQLGLKLAFIKGAAGLPVVLRASAFDTEATLRERMNVTLNEEEMPYFKEGIVVKESDRQQLNLIAQTGNQALIDTIIESIFDDESRLLSGAHARLQAMRFQVLATGKIGIISNGVARDIDYGVADANKGAVKTAWSDAANATPLADISKAMDALAATGAKAEVLILNSKTFAEIKAAKSTLYAIKPTAPDTAGVTNRELTSYLESEYGLAVAIENGTYKDDDGVTKKFYPDGRVTLAPNGALGKTVFGTTPEESDLLGGNSDAAKVSIVDTGIAVTTIKHADPVNVETKVSMIALPSFERLDEVYMLSTVPQA